MRKVLASIALLLSLVGCGTEAQSDAKPVVVERGTPPKSDLDFQLTRLHYYLRVKELGDDATASMYTCISEIYALGHHGPACRSTCGKYAALIEIDSNPPTGVERAGDQRPEMPKWCAHAKKILAKEK